MAEVREPVVAQAVEQGGAVLCWLWWSEEDHGKFGVIPVRGNPRNVHAAVRWLGLVRFHIARGMTLRQARAELAGGSGEALGREQAFESLTELHSASIATD